MIRVVTNGNSVSLERKGTNEEIVEEYLGTFMALISSYVDLAKEYYSSEEEIEGLIDSTLALIKNSLKNSVKEVVKLN